MWQSGKGCVIIHINGRNAERLLNSLRGERIVLQRICRISDEELQLTMPAQDFFRIRCHAKRLHCRVHIIERQGFIFAWMRLLRRRTLWIGCLLGLLLTAAASMRIWVVRVEGNSRVAETTVRRALRREGIYPGAARPDRTFDAIADAVATFDERIAWVGLDLDGVCVTAHIVEAEQSLQMQNAATHCDVVAVKDGIITQMQALEGVPQFSPGEAVQAGDVLISGTVPLTDIPEPLLVHARGTVRAKVYYFSEFAQSLTGNERLPTGQEAPYRRIELCGRKLYESRSPFADAEITECSAELLTVPLLPVRIVTGVYREMAVQECTLTAAEAAEIAAVEAEKGAMLRIPNDAAVCEKYADWMEYDGLVLATCAIVCEESIGLTREITN